jgi:hypothetical protein
MRFTLRLLIVALLLWSGWACTDTLVDVVDVAVLEIEPRDVSLTAGESRQLQARVRDAQGNILSGRSIQWSSNATSVASVGPDGMVLGVSTGDARITAVSEGIQGTADVTVAPAPVILAQPDSVPLEAVIDEAQTAAGTIAITNDGGGTLAGLVAAVEYDSGSTDWLDATLSEPVAPATLTVTANAAGLARGTYKASVRLTSTSIGAAPVVVRVVFTVLQRSPAPTLVSVTPDRSAREQSLSVIMTGSGFVPGLTTVDFGPGIAVNNVNVEGPTTLTTSITVGATAAVGIRTVSVINPAPGGGTASLADAFTVEGLNPRPTVTSVEPAGAQRQSTLDVAVTGTGFLDDITIADFGPGITINSIVVTSATALTANITISAAAETGIRDITVANPEPGGGVGTLREAFTVTAANPPPTLTSVSPASAQRRETISVQLTGGNFATDLTTIDFGAGITVSDMTVTSATTITAGITIDSAAALGARAVSVTNAGPGGGSATLADGFTVLDANPAPAVQSIAPVSGRLGQTLDVVVTGTGFVAGVTTATFGAGIVVNSVSVADATSLTANISVAGDAALGMRSVTATNAAPGGGAGTLADAFTVVGAVSADLSTVTAAPSTAVAADGAAVSTVTVVVRDAASGAVTGLAPGSFSLSVTGSATTGVIAETTTPGTYQFTVSNTVAETVTVNVTADGVALTAAPTIAFVATVVSAANSSVAADPLTGVTADGVAGSVVTVVLRDANNNAIGDLSGTAFDITVGGSATAGAITETATAGTYTFTVVNTVAEAVTVSVSAGGVALSQQPVIEFVPGSGSAAHSAATVPPGTAGTETPITITVRDASDNPVIGAASDLVVSITGANTDTPAVTDNGDGTYSAPYTPTIAGSDNVAIALGGEAIAGSPFTSVVSPGAISATVSAVAAAPPTVVADGTAAATVTVTLRDAHDNPIAGVAPTDFVLGVTGSGIAGTLTETTTPGTYTFVVTNTVAQTVTVTVEVRGVALDDEPTIQFTAGGVSATNSGATADPASGVVANGTAASTVTVTLRDASNNVVAGLDDADFTITVSPSGTAGTVSEISTPGSYRFAVTNTVAQSVAVEVQAGGVTLSQQPVIQFVAGPASQIAINAGNNQNATIGTAVAIAPSVIIQDANSNPVAGVSVTFAPAAGSGSLSASGVVTTNASGIATSPAWTLGTTAGPNTLTATSGSLTGSPVTFTATGTAGTATQMSLTTQPSASAITGVAFAQQPVIQLRDDSGNPVADEGVVVTASIATGGGMLGGTLTATTSASGVATFTNLSIAGLVGDRTLQFEAPGIATVTSNAISITAGAASVMAVNAGDGQSATVGAAVTVPPSVVVTDASDNPIAGVSVTFAVASGSGSLASDGTVTTNGAGIATSPAWTLGTTAGTNTLTATSAGLTNSPITFTATGTSGAATQMTIETQPSATAQSGAAFAQQPVIQIRDGSGNAVAEAGVVITAAIASGGGTLGGTVNATTNTSGVATFTGLSIIGAAGDRTLEFTSGGITAVTSGTIAIGAGAATQLTITTQPSSTAQSGVAFARQPAIQLRDGGGNAVATAGTIVTAAVATGGGTLGGGVTAATDAAGVATFTDLSISGLIGNRTLSFSAAAVTPVTSGTINVAAGSAAQMAINSGNNQTSTAGQPVPFSPTVVVRDASGNRVAGVSVTFAVSSGGGSLPVSGAVVTDALGIATSPVWTLGAVAGENTLTATSAGLTGSPLVFTATGVAGDASLLSITTQPSTSAPSGAAFVQQPVIQLRDGNNNVVATSGVMVTAAIASGAGTLGGNRVATTDAAGVATFIDLSIAGAAGTHALSFTSGALTAATSSSIDITAGAATQVAINAGNNQSATIGTAVTIAPSVIVTDASSNPVAGVSVTFAVASGGGSLAASGTVTTDASGVATSPAWTLGTTAGTNTLTATSAGLTGSPVTFTATGTAGVATNMTITAQPSASAPSGAAFAQQPVIQIRDSGGNVVAEAGIVVTASIASGGGTLGGAFDATTNASGVASFTNLSITGTVGDRTLQFAAPGIAPATSGVIAITVGAATQLTLTSQPSAASASGAVFAQQPAIQLRDGGGNAVAQTGVVVTATIASGGGTLGGTPTATTGASGLATFTDLSITGLVGARTLSFTSGGLTAATSSSIEITAGAATQIAVNAGDGQSATIGTAVAVAPSIVVRDGGSNPVAGVSVTFAVTSGGGSIAANGTVTTNASGIATSPAWTLGPTAGSNTLTATSGGLTGSPVTFTATGTVGAATQLTITTQPSASAASGAAFAQQPAIQLRDGGGNAVAQAGVVVTAAIASGDGTLGGTLEATTDAAGLATFIDLSIAGPAGTRTLSFTSGALTAATSSSIEITVGAATQIAVNAGDGQSATIGTAVAVAPSVVVRDGGSNPVAGVSVTFAVSSGGGSLSASGTVTTDASGIATSPAWTLGPTAGSNTLTATSAGLTGSPVTFTATGTVGAATQLTITTQPSPSAASGAAFTRQPAIQLRDGGGNAVAQNGVIVTALIASGGGTLGGTLEATTDAAGLATFTDLSITGLVGARTLSFTGGALTAATSSAIDITAGAATQIAVNAGNNQSATIGTAVAIAPSVIVQDASSNPVAGVSVTFAPAAGSGSLAGSGVVVTNASGIATSPAWTLGTTAGPNTLTATSAGLTGSPVTFTATGTAGTATQMSLTTQPSAAAVTGAAFAQQPVVQLLDGSGNAVADEGVVVTASIATGGGTLGGTLTATTSASGVATFTNLSIAGLVGDRTLQFEAPGIATVTSNTISITAGAASVMAVNAGDGQSATVGAAVTVPPSVLVTDASGNPISGVSVTFAVASGGGSLASDGTVTTDGAGIATSPAWTLGTTAGSNTLTATSAGLTNSPITFTATGTSGAATQMTIQTQPSATAQSGAAFAQQPVIRIRDVSGNTVAEAGVVITAAIASGGGTLGGTVSATTNAAGVATFTNLSITGIAGDRTLEFTAGGITPVVSGTISIGAGAATQLTITTQPASTAQSGIAFAQQPAIQLRDGGGNAVATAGVTVTAAIASGGGTLGGGVTAATDAAGVATFTDLSISGLIGNRTLSFSAAAVTPVTSGTISVAAGSAAQMAVNSGNNQTSTAGQPVPFSPTVVVRDASGNRVAGVSVTFAISSGGGSLAVSGTVVTDALGIATSPVWTLGAVAGENTLTATSTGLTGSPVTFTATGTAGAATQLSITTQPSATAASGATFAQQPVIQLRDSNNNAVATSGVMVTAAIASGAGTLGGSPVATTDAAGVATFTDLSIAGTAGAHTLSFTSGALTAATSSSIDITAGAATQVAINAGNNQSATIGTAVAVAPSVLVRDASLNPVAGVSVTFAVASGSGSLSGSGTVTTNASGIAMSPAWTLGTTAGANTLTATAAGLTGSPVTFTATATAGAATQLTITTQPSATAVSGTAFAQQPAVQLRDGTGNAVAQAGTVVTAAIASGGVALGGTLTATTNAAGLATFADLVVTGLVGERTLSFTSGALTAATSNAISITAGAATQIAVNGGNNQSATVGTAVAVAPSVLVRDASLNPVSGVSVTFAVASGGGSLATSGTVTTNASGIATSPAWTLGTTAGSNTLSATSAGLTGSPVTFTATGTAGAATQLTITTQPSATATSGAAFAQQPAVQLRDGPGNAVEQAGTVVTAAIASGGVALGGTLTATTNAAGLATFSNLSITGLAGERTLSFTSGALTAATSNAINITAGAATQVAINAGNNQSATAGTAVAVAPSVLVRDASLNPVSGVSVTFAVASGGGSLAASGTVTTNASGIATSPAWTLGTTAGSNTLSATSAGLTGSPVTFTATGTVGAATQLTMTTQPSATAASGAAFAQQPAIQLRDGGANAVAQTGVVVTAAIASGDGTLGGTVDATTDAAGLATFTNLSITGLAGERTLSFTSGALTAATSSSIDITAGAATQIALNAGDGQSATAGAAVAVAPSVIVTDASSNPVAGVSVTFAVASGGGSLAAGGIVTTDASGVATSPAWTLGTTAGANSLTATAAGLAGSPVTFTATGTAGAATQLTITTQPSATATSGAAFTRQPAIQLRDGSGNGVEQAGVIVTAAIASGDEALGGTLTATTDAAGLATFTNLSITGLAGSRTLSFTSGALTAATSSSIEIAAGAATQIAVNGGNNPSATVGTAVAVTPSVIVRDASLNPVAGVSVTFAVASGGGSLAASGTVTTDASGIATSPAWTLGTTAGTNTLTATSAGLTGSPVTFTATGTVGAATQLTITTQPSATAASGDAFAQQPAIQLRDGGANAVAQTGVVVTAAIASGDGTLGGTVDATTDAAGLATFTDLSITGLVGARMLSFTSGALTAATSSSIDVTAGAATQIALNAGDGQSATAGTAVAVAPSVIVTDDGSNPVAGVSVTFAVVSGGGSLAASGIVTTDASGIATSPAWTLGATAGTNTLTATSAGLTNSPITFTATGTAGSETQITITTQPSATATSGTAFAQQPAIQLRDGSGNAVAQTGVVVTAAIGSGDGTLGGTVDATTDAAGLATFTDLSITGLAGVRTLSFTSGALTAATSSSIEITAGAATQVAINAGDNQSATIGTAVAVAPSVIVRDGGSNPVAGVSVTFAVASGGGSLAAGGDVTTDASGIATSPAWTLGTTAGPNTLTATSAGLTGSPVTFTATGTVGAATQLTITTQPSATAASGAAFAQQPAIQLRDGGANAVAQTGVVVTAAIASGDGTLGGTVDATTDAAGLATFTDLSITGLVGARTLSFTSGALTAATSSSIDVTAGAATTIAENGGNNQSATVGTAVATAPSVLVTDGGGNPIAGVSVTFAVASGGGSLATTDPVVTDAAGIAVSPAWTLGAVEGPNTLTATAAGLTGSPVTFTATATP